LRTITRQAPPRPPPGPWTRGRSIVCGIASRVPSGARGYGAQFVAALAALDVEAPTPSEWTRIAELVDTYADFPLGTTDASVIALAERLDAEHVITLDVRHFHAVRPRHRDALQLLPD
jgi:uncharacterized protein